MMDQFLDKFLRFSAELTASNSFELLGTGQAQTYLTSARKVVGDDLLNELFAAHASIAAGDSDVREAQIRRQILGDERLGPIARNIVKLWFTGIWYELPHAWSEAYGARENDTTFVTSPAAYAEGLLWTAIGAHAPGAKAPGYSSWTGPPVIPAVSTQEV
jgi:hypothetical protein